MSGGGVEISQTTGQSTTAIMSQKAVTDMVTEYNVSKLHPTGGISGTDKYTLETAIAKIPAELRYAGIKCSFIDEGDCLKTYVNQDGTFTSADSWVKSVDTNIDGVYDKAAVLKDVTHIGDRSLKLTYHQGDNISQKLFAVSVGARIVVIAMIKNSYGWRIDEYKNGTMVKIGEVKYSTGKYEFTASQDCDIYLFFDNRETTPEGNIYVYVDNLWKRESDKLDLLDQSFNQLTENAFSNTLKPCNHIKELRGYPNKSNMLLIGQDRYTSKVYQIDRLKKLHIALKGQNPNAFCIGLSNYLDAEVFEHKIDITDANASIDVGYTGYNYIIVCVSNDTGSVSASVLEYESSIATAQKVTTSIADKIDSNEIHLTNEAPYPTCENVNAISIYKGTARLIKPGVIEVTQIAASEGEWFSFVPHLDLQRYEAGHRYMLVIDWMIKIIKCGGVLQSVNQQFSAAARNNGSTPFDEKLMKTVNVGKRVQSTVIFSMPREIPENKATLSIQYNTKMYNSKGDNIILEVYNIAFIDITSSGKAFALKMIADEGYKKEYDFVNTELTADLSKRLQGSTKGISFWGDSLMNGNYPELVAQKLGVECVKNNFGGRTSSTIREEFIKHYKNFPEELEYTHVFCVGRNNLARPQDTVRDLREMVSLLPHSKYLIMMPPNGNYEGEYKGGAAYNNVIWLSDMLHKCFGGAYFDWRSSLINGYDYGGVRLESSFIQPSIGKTVQINVSDADFLITYNNMYMDKSHRNFIRIGDLMHEKMNKYEVVSKDDSTHLTVKAISEEFLTQGEQISNHQYNDTYNNSYGYIDVVQESDYQTYIGDNTPTTLRTDNIHMASVKAQEFTANLVIREICARGLQL